MINRPIEKTQIESSVATKDFSGGNGKGKSVATGEGPDSDRVSDLDLRLAKPMFGLSLLFLALIAALVVLWVDIPRVEMLASEASVAESAEGLADASGIEGKATKAPVIRYGDYCMFALLAIWPLFWAEFAYKVRTHDKSKGSFFSKRVFDTLICVCPPLRLAAPNYNNEGKIWLPKLNWQQPGKQLSRILEKAFGPPMLLIALFILPVLLVEFGLKEIVESNFAVRLALHICTGLIWCAFAIEFLIMICATDRKLAYVKKNWLDLAIILLPLISFLRSLRAVRAFRVAKFAKVQQLAKLGRVYRMRGLMTKALKALMLLEFLNRLLRITPEKQLAKLKMQRAERVEELEELDSDIRQLERKISAKKEEAAIKEEATKKEEAAIKEEESNPAVDVKDSSDDEVQPVAPPAKQNDVRSA